MSDRKEIIYLFQSLQTHFTKIKVHVQAVPVARVVDLQQSLLAQAEVSRWTCVVDRLVDLRGWGVLGVKGKTALLAFLHYSLGIRIQVIRIVVVLIWWRWELQLWLSCHVSILVTQRTIARAIAGIWHSCNKPSFIIRGHSKESRFPPLSAYYLFNTCPVKCDFYCPPKLFAGGSCSSPVYPQVLCNRTGSWPCSRSNHPRYKAPLWLPPFRIHGLFNI